MQPDKKLPSLFRLFCAAVLLTWAVLMPLPGSSSATDLEIEHLLHYIEASGCTFIRNHKEYDANEARKHIENKYEHIKRWVHTTEDFIKYAATRSSMTGKPYMISCDGQEHTSAEWLKAELERMRKP